MTARLHEEAMLSSSLTPLFCTQVMLHLNIMDPVIQPLLLGLLRRQAQQCPMCRTFSVWAPRCNNLSFEFITPACTRFTRHVDDAEPTLTQSADRPRGRAAGSCCQRVWLSSSRRKQFTPETLTCLPSEVVYAMHRQVVLCTCATQMFSHVDAMR